MNSQLLFEIFERIEAVSGIKVFVVLAVATFHLAVVPWSVRTNELVPDATLFERTLKQCEVVVFRTAKTLGELKAVVGLDTLHLNALFRKMFDDVQRKLRRAVGAVLLKCF